MTIPHHFPSLIEGPAQAVLIAGAGLSSPNAPTIDGLMSGLVRIAHKLGVGTSDDFYELAEAVLDNLVNGGKTDHESRLWLAEKLDLFDDRRWFAEIGLPLSGNTPRHRAIARFAAEKRLRAIISLNWDTLLEAALESVGLAEDIRSARPWEVTAHARVVHDSHLPLLGSTHVFPVIKPHGCVRDLDRARRKFRSTGVIDPITLKVTQSELDNLPGAQTLVDKKVENYVSECALIAAGWKAREGYLRNTVIKSAQAVTHTEPDAFTLVSRSWYPKLGSTDTFHDDIATAYGTTRSAAFIEVANPGQPTLDRVFQWLQARHALHKLIGVSQAAQQVELEKLLLQIDQPECAHPILKWVDSWLPIWVRLCWRSGVMQGCDPHTNQQVESYEIPIMPRDVHVPMGGMCVPRSDLHAAAKILLVLGNGLNKFNYEMFPGGFWEDKTRCLYIPLPGWPGATRPGDLAALRPLIEALRSLGFVRNIYLVWLDTEDTPPNQADRDQLSAQVRRLMPLASFAASEALAWVDLATLSGGAHEIGS